MTLTMRTTDSAVSILDGAVELARYTVVPDVAQLESPKPFLHPIRTRAGHVVSLFRPWDHVWHNGLAWSLPVVGDANFWGGPTYLSESGYVQLSNNGAQRHRGILEERVVDGVARYAHALTWVAEDGSILFAEERGLTARILDDESWALTFHTAMTNTTDSSIALGSPTTRGRENAGYGGLFWRGPRSFQDGVLVTVDGAGAGNDVRGQRHEWMAYEGKHDGIDAVSLVAMVDAPGNPHHPPQWFARSEDFAAMNPAPFFSEEVVIAPGETVDFRYAVGFADAGRAAVPTLIPQLKALVG